MQEVIVASGEARRFGIMEDAPLLLILKSPKPPAISPSFADWGVSLGLSAAAKQPHHYGAGHP